MPLSFSARVSVAPAVLFRQVGEESVLLNVKTNIYLGLDPVGTQMWKLVTTAESVQAAYETLLAEYDIDPDTLRHDLDEFLASLLEQSLVEIGEKKAARQESA